MIIDPLAGPVLVLGGAPPMAARVTGTRGLLKLMLGDVPGAELTQWNSTAWSGVVPSDMLHYRQVMMVPLNGLLPVDMLYLGAGQRRGYDVTFGYFCWQAASKSLSQMTEVDARLALASPWRKEMLGGARGTRAIVLAE